MRVVVVRRRSRPRTGAGRASVGGLGEVRRGRGRRTRRGSARAVASSISRIGPRRPRRRRSARPRMLGLDQDPDAAEVVGGRPSLASRSCSMDRLEPAMDAGCRARRSPRRARRARRPASSLRTYRRKNWNGQKVNDSSWLGLNVCSGPNRSARSGRRRGVGEPAVEAVERPRTCVRSAYTSRAAAVAAQGRAGGRAEPARPPRPPARRRRQARATARTRASAGRAGQVGGAIAGPGRTAQCGSWKPVERRGRGAGAGRRGTRRRAAPGPSRRSSGRRGRSRSSAEPSDAEEPEHLAGEGESARLVGVGRRRRPRPLAGRERPLGQVRRG